jgi:dienelactone hydrolase
MRERSLAIHLLAISVTATLPWLATSDSSSETCTPFGNAPATITGPPIVPTCPGGQLLGPWSDADGMPRYACLYESVHASTSQPLPLVVFLHPSLTTADALHQYTNLLSFLDTANVSDDPAVPGFIVIAPQGRHTTHFYPPPDDSASGWDNWYRQMDPRPIVRKRTVFEENVDAATIDHFIETEVASGKVNRDRIYVTGWSNGAAMAYLYGTARPRIAAVAVYSAPDPWHFLNDPCPQKPVAFPFHKSNTDLPIQNFFLPTIHVHNGCDIMGQCPNDERMMKQLLPLGVSVQDTVLDWTGTPYPDLFPGPVAANACTDACGTDPNGGAGTIQGLLNHIRWPYDYTVVMLDFFRAHPRNLRLGVF